MRQTILLVDGPIERRALCGTRMGPDAFAPDCHFIPASTEYDGEVRMTSREQSAF